MWLTLKSETGGLGRATMAKLQIKRICPAGDTDIRVYFSKQKLVATICAGEAGMPQELLADADPFLETLLAIPGVYTAEYHQYHVAIRKTPMHDWEEIEPHLLKLLSSFNRDLEELEK